MFNGDAGIWHETAPAAVREAAGGGDRQQAYRRWGEYLRDRRKPFPLDGLCRHKDSPLAWGLAAVPSELESSDTARMIARLHDLGRGKQGERAIEAEEVRFWLDEAGGGRHDARYALECLAWARDLPRLAAEGLEPDVWTELVEHLREATDGAAKLKVEERPLVNQLLAGELALTLAALFPELRPCRGLKKPARKTLSEGIVDLLDGEGLMEGRHLALLRPLLACWTRSAEVGRALKKGAWNSEADTQYAWLVRQALRLARRDGTQMLSSAEHCPWEPELFAAALDVGGDRDDRELAAVVLPGGKKTWKARGKAEEKLPEPAYESEWARVAMLRTRWSPRGESLLVNFDDTTMKSELSAGGEVFWSGDWPLEIKVGGKAAKPAGDWDEVCWMSDEDADYLELELELSGGLRVQRQILLAREDRFLFVADALLGEREARIEYRTVLPLAPGTAFEMAEETRDGVLTCGKRRALVLPPAMPEWRSEPWQGDLVASQAGLELAETAQGRSLLVPLFIDLDPRRQDKELTWRRLTVAQQREIVPRDEAVGYRIQVGKKQWLIYRSLTAKPQNRTVLGQNFMDECAVGRFDRDGEFDSLLQIA